jgi:hypothetical protein
MYLNFLENLNSSQLESLRDLLNELIDKKKIKETQKDFISQLRSNHNNNKLKMNLESFPNTSILDKDLKFFNERSLLKKNKLQNY